MAILSSFSAESIRRGFCSFSSARRTKFSATVPVRMGTSLIGVAISGYDLDYKDTSLHLIIQQSGNFRVQSFNAKHFYDNYLEIVTGGKAPIERENFDNQQSLSQDSPPSSGNTHNIQVLISAVAKATTAESVIMNSLFNLTD